MISSDTAHPETSFGDLLRDWRRRRRVSQLGLASEAEISQKHLSFIESGRSRPSREMVLHLAEQLELPLRERNRLLLAAGYAPVFRQRAADDPAMREAMAAVEIVLRAHEPYPALAIDRAWTLRAANRMVPALIGPVAPHLLQPPVNVIRLSLHPEGLAPRIRNLPVWRAHVLARLRRSADLSGDPALAALHAELAALPAGGPPPRGADAAASLALTVRLDAPDGTPLALVTTVTVFGTPHDIGLEDLAIETLLPADPATAAALRRLHREQVEPTAAPDGQAAGVTSRPPRA